jgi:hypothetical protein
MIKLDLKREDYWLDLGYGVRVKVHPASTALVMAARVSALRPTPKTLDSEARRLSKNLPRWPSLNGKALPMMKATLPA